MKNALIFIGLVILSVLYLFEVDFSHISWMNITAFVIIALTLIPLLWRMLSGIIAHFKEQEEKQEKHPDGKD